jgi:hypothetical protein
LWIVHQRGVLGDDLHYSVAGHEKVPYRKVDSLSGRFYQWIGFFMVFHPKMVDFLWKSVTTQSVIYS